MNAVLEKVFLKSELEDEPASIAPSTDSKTGLLTRTGFMGAAGRILSHGGRLLQSYAAISVELDNFSAEDLARDQERGSPVICEIANRIRAAVREEDLVGLTEADEFVILMPNISSDVAVLNVAQRIQAAVSKPIIEEVVQLYPSLTIGVSIADPNQNPVFEEVLYRSDQALKQARLVCRGAVHFFDTELSRELDRKSEIGQQLRRAVQHDELRLHYQPIIDVENSVISHVEALVRWQHPELGLVPPADFIPVAESSGIIQSVGDWVLQQAIEDLQLLDEAGLRDICVSVNLSPEQLKLSTIFETIVGAFAFHPGERGRFALEVTEAVVIDERYQMTEKLNALRAQGFRIFLDDFGTGNASIARLRQMELDAIKIDRSLITNIDRNSADLAIVRSILHLAESLGLTAIAEGVETRTCLELLSREKCRYAQGYYFSHPLPIAETIEVIQEKFETTELANALSSL